MASIKANVNKEGQVISFRFRACVGRDEYGKQIFIAKTQKVTDDYAAMTPKKLEKAMQTLADTWEETERDKLKNDIHTASDREKFSNFVNTTFWDSHVLHHKPRPLSATTINFYEIITKQILNAPQFKDKNLTAITQKNIDSYIHSLQDTDTAQSTIKHHYDVLNIIFKFAYDKDYIERNPMKKADPVTVERKPVTRLSADDETAFRNAIDKKDKNGLFIVSWKHRAMVLLMLDMGLRRGEVAGLRWKDIDFENRTITICNNIVYTTKNSRVEKDPKSTTSKRILPMDEKTVFPALDIWNRKLESKQQFTLSPDAYVFPASDERPFDAMNPQSITHWLNRFAEENSLPHIHPHMLRHTFGSVKMAEGENPALVSRYMGHSDINTTMKSYVEFSADDLRQVVGNSKKEGQEVG